MGVVSTPLSSLFFFYCRLLTVFRSPFATGMVGPGHEEGLGQVRTRACTWVPWTGRTLLHLSFSRPSPGPLWTVGTPRSLFPDPTFTPWTTCRRSLRGSSSLGSFAGIRDRCHGSMTFPTWKRFTQGSGGSSTLD